MEESKTCQKRMTRHSNCFDTKRSTYSNKSFHGCHRTANGRRHHGRHCVSYIPSALRTNAWSDPGIGGKGNGADEGYGNQGSHQALEEAANPFGSQNVGAHFPDLVARALFVILAGHLQPRLDQIQRISNHRARHPRREPERSNEQKK